MRTGHGIVCAMRMCGSFALQSRHYTRPGQIGLENHRASGRTCAHTHSRRRADTRHEMPRQTFAQTGHAYANIQQLIDPPPAWWRAGRRPAARDPSEGFEAGTAGRGRAQRLPGFAACVDAALRNPEDRARAAPPPPAAPARRRASSPVRARARRAPAGSKTRSACHSP